MKKLLAAILASMVAVSMTTVVLTMEVSPDENQTESSSEESSSTDSAIENPGGSSSEESSSGDTSSETFRQTLREGKASTINITGVSISLRAPATGGNAENTAGVLIIPEKGQDFVRSCSVVWEPSDSTFKPGTEYKAIMILTPESGFKFNADTIATVNGDNATASLNGEKLEVEYTFPPTEKETISSVAIIIQEPVAGGTMSRAVVADNANYEAGLTSWSPSDSTFKPGTEYKAIVTLNPKTGYKFEAGATATVNSQSAAAASDGNNLTVEYTFPATEKVSISSVGVTLTAPVKRPSPDDASVPGDAHCTVIGDVAWSPLLDNSAFSPDTTYTATITLKPDAGYVFSSSSTATVNNESATASLDGGNLQVTYTFPATEKEPIPSVAVTLAAPVKGQLPDLSPVIPANAVYTVVGTTDWEPELDATGHFKPSEAYTATVTLEPEEHYTFHNGTTATVNGQAAASVNFSYDRLYVKYQFPATAPEDAPPPPPPVTDNTTSGNSSGGGNSYFSGSSASTSNPLIKRLRNNPLNSTGKTVSPSKMRDAVNNALKSSGINNGVVSVNFQNVTTITPDAISAGLEAARKAGAENVMIQVDTVVNGMVSARVYIDANAASGLKGPINTRLIIADSTLKTSSVKPYCTPGSSDVLHFGQPGPLGMTVQVAVKLNPLHPNANKLALYRYDPITEKYVPIPSASVVASNGYVYFSVDAGGDYILK